LAAPVVMVAMVHRPTRTCLAAVLLGCTAAAAIEEPAVESFYSSFDVPKVNTTTFEEVKKSLLRGAPLVVLDGAKGLAMASWDCETVRTMFPDSMIRQEGSQSETNKIKMSSDWTLSQKKFPGADKFPAGAPKFRPFYWDIVKASQEEPNRKWGKKPGEVVKKMVQATGVPYFLPKQDSRDMGFSSEMWFHPPGGGALAHMDPHCRTTVSFCFSGTRKWRMMVPPTKPHADGYFDGQIYGAMDPKRRDEWKPTFEFEAPAGSAVFVYPGMIHETANPGDSCSSSISQVFAVPLAAAYFRAFWPRFSLIDEDVGRCGDVVATMANLGSGERVKPAKAEKAREAGQKFASAIDADGDGIVSVAEMTAANKKGERTLDELISFHDVDADGVVTTKEVEDSWVMFAASMHRAKNMKKSGGQEL